MTTAFVLIFGRSLGFVMKAPGLSHPCTPKMVRVICAAGIALALSGLYMHQASQPPACLLLAFLLEILLGAALGILSSVLFDGAYAGGRMLDDYLGIRSAMPMANVASGAEFGRLWSNAFLAGFLLSGGFERLVIVFAQTFSRLPPGTLPTRGQILQYAVTIPTFMVQSACLLVGPAIATVFVAQMCLGCMGRVVPKLSTFALSFPIVYGIALGVSFAAIPEVLPLSMHPWFAMPFHHHG